MNTKVDILAFGAHPDDVECAVGDVLLKHIEMGKVVAIFDLSAGEMGSYGTMPEREKEAALADKLMEAGYSEQLNLPDGGIKNNDANRMLAIEMNRKYCSDPGFLIDVINHLGGKMKVILPYKSKLVSSGYMQPNSILGWHNQIKSMNSIYGRPINAAYAAGFTIGRYISVDNFYHLA